MNTVNKIRFMRKSVCLSILLIAFPLLGQQLKLNMDYAAFKYDSNHSNIEVYYKLGYDSIPSQGNSAERSIPWITHMSLSVSRYDSIYGKNEWTNRSTADLGSANGLEYLGMLKFQVPAGGYRVSLFAYDSTFQSTSDTVYVQFPIWAYSEKQTILSDIELGSSIRGSSEAQSSLFYKNGLIIYPISDKRIFTTNNKLFYYLEAYHLVSSQVSGDYYLGINLLNDKKQKATQTVYKKYSKENMLDAMAAFGEVAIDTMESGKYSLVIDLLDSTGRKLTSRNKEFIIEKIEQKQENLMVEGFERSQFASMDSASVEIELATLQYIAPSEMKPVLKKLDNLTAKRKFLNNYWIMQDPNGKNSRNERYWTHQDRIRIAEESFGSALHKGWRTDRGRVVILYGPPDSIERFPDSIDKYPYEIWYFDSIEKGVQFVFADYAGQGDFIQIYSDKKGEVYNPSWESTLYRTAGSSN